MEERPARDAMPPNGLGEAPSLSFLCHELRQPLVVAVGYVSMLEDGSFGELPAEAGPVLRTVSERLDRMNELIDRILDSGSSSRLAPE